MLAHMGAIVDALQFLSSVCVGGDSDMWGHNSMEPAQTLLGQDNTQKPGPQGLSMGDTQGGQGVARQCYSA